MFSGGTIWILTHGDVFGLVFSEDILVEQLERERRPTTWTGQANFRDTPTLVLKRLRRMMFVWLLTSLLVV